MTTETRAARKSAEGRKVQAEALHASITEQVDALRSTGQWQRFLDFAQSFHTYSFSNLVLIFAQRPDATAVAGFRAWQAKGRQVRKGEHGIRIFGYRQQLTIDQDEDGQEVQKAVTRFPVLTVFDINQTDPIDGVSDNSSITQQLTGTDDLGIIDALGAYLSEQGWTIERRRLPGAINGYTEPGQRLVVIDARLSPEHAAKTLLHETAHIRLGHTDNIVGLMLNESAYISEIVRSGLESVDRGQNEAALSLGMTPMHSMRKIIVPQAIRIMVPPLGNSFNGLMKSTSILSIIGVSEMFQVGSTMSASTFKVFEIYIVVALYYLLLTTVWTFVQAAIENSLNARAGLPRAESVFKRLFGVRGKRPQPATAPAPISQPADAA